MRVYDKQMATALQLEMWPEKAALIIVIHKDLFSLVPQHAYPDIIYSLVYNHSGTKQHCSTSVQPGTNCSAPIV